MSGVVGPAQDPGPVKDSQPQPEGLSSAEFRPSSGLGTSDPGIDRRPEGLRGTSEGHDNQMHATDER